MTAKSVEQQLVGTWHLVSAEWTGKDGQKLDPVEGDTKGILMLDPTGHFSFQLLSDARHRHKLKWKPEGTLEEPKGVATRVVACFGTYSVKKDDGGDALIFHVKGHSLPGMEGKDLKRTIIKLAGNELTDSNPETSWGARSVIKWERAS